jgi:hypothetical protein
MVMIAWPLAPSSAAVGSSARIVDGSATIARAIATRALLAADVERQTGLIDLGN